MGKSYSQCWIPKAFLTFIFVIIMLEIEFIKKAQTL